MRYFVVAQDGSRYGPADLGMLNEWVHEGRVLPSMILEEEDTTERVQASSIPGLDFGGAPKPGYGAEAAIAGGSAYEATSAGASRDLWLAMAMAPLSVVLSLFMVLGLFTAILGAMAGFRAKESGEPLAPLAIGANVLAMLVWGVVTLFGLGR